MDKKTAHKLIQAFWDGTLPVHYREIVGKWLLGNKDEDAKDEAIQNIWDTTSNEMDASTAESLEVFRANRKRMAQRKTVSLKKILRYAAVLLLPIITGLAVWNYAAVHFYNASEMLECYVPDGQVKTISLSDGTTVEINSGTTVLYPKDFGRDVRKVYLQGEAHFKVAKDSKHPFVVSAGKLNVQVLGTHFDVKAYSDQTAITTTLEEGSVVLYEKGKEGNPVLLRPDEQAVYERSTGKIAVTEVESANYSSWTAGNLNFDQQPLSDILETLEHHFNVRFIVDHSIDLNKQYTMNFKSYETLDDVLLIYIQVAGNIIYKKEGHNVKLFIKRKEASL
jgi:transmembrane sensor